MKLREIKQHNFFSILVIITLLIADMLSFYFAYKSVLVIKNLNEIVGNPYSIIVSMIFLLYFFNSYNPASMLSRSREILKIFRINFCYTFLYITYKLLLGNISISHLQYILLLSIFFFLSTISLRLIIRTIQKQLLHINIGLKNIIIIGSNDKAIDLVRQIQSKNNFGYNLLGYFSNNENNDMSKISKHLGSINDVQNFIILKKINEVIITFKKDRYKDLMILITKLKDLDVNIKIIPDTYDVITGFAKIHNVTGMPLIDINPNILTELQYTMKRSIDIILSSFALVILFIPLIIIAILIKFTTPGKVIFKQKRVGLNGNEFIVHKFRTMYSNSEKKTGPVWATKNDPRITPIGNFLRKSRLDEFPQLYDVLIGNMSIVGPRPERKFFIEKLEKKFPYYSRRLSIRPGITGWAQIMGDYDTDLDNVKNKLKLDFYYIENISIWLDIKIMILTVWVMLRSKGH